MFELVRKFFFKPTLSEMTNVELIEASQELAREEDLIRARRVEIADELRRRESRGE